MFAVSGQGRGFPAGSCSLLAGTATKCSEVINKQLLEPLQRPRRRVSDSWHSFSGLLLESDATAHTPVCVQRSRTSQTEGGGSVCYTFVAHLSPSGSCQPGTCANSNPSSLSPITGPRASPVRNPGNAFFSRGSLGLCAVSVQI